MQQDEAAAKSDSDIIIRLVIFAPAFSIPSETFIRAHLANICPGETASICWKGRPISGPSGTELTLTEPRRRFPNLFNRRFSADDIDRAVGFLRELGSPPVLFEYGPTALRGLEIVEKAGSELIVHFHGSDVSKRLRNPLLKGQYRKLFDKARGIIAPSKFLLDRLIAVGCPPEKAHVVPCGVDPDGFRTPTPDPNKLIAVGRLVDKKAPLTTIRAFARVAEKHPQAHLDIVGTGALLEPAAALVSRLAMADQITLHGALPHEKVRDMLCNASLFLQHSVTAKSGDTEGMPVSILEAMAVGLGIITTRHSGIPEAITDGREGLLTDEHDEAAMGTAIDRLLADPDEARALGAAAQARFQANFTQSITSEKLRRIIFEPAQP